MRLGLHEDLAPQRAFDFEISPVNKILSRSLIPPLTHLPALYPQRRFMWTPPRAPDTSTGLARVMNSEGPSSPRWFVPQHLTPSSAMMAHVWRFPAEMAAAKKPAAMIKTTEFVLGIIEI